MASQIYFSKELRLLTLRQTVQEVREGVNVADKFGNWMVFVARTVLLTMAGMAMREEEFEEMEREMRIAVSEEGIAVDYESPKRVKRDF